MSFNYVPETEISTLFTIAHLPVTESHMVGTTVPSISERNKLTWKEVKQVIQGHMADKHES